MKYFSSVIALLFFVSCGSSPFEQQKERQNRINQHLAQGMRYIDGEFDSKFNRDGSDSMFLMRIGVAAYPLAYNEELIKSAAISDGKFKLISSAPTEMKSMVQKAIGNSMGYLGEYSQIETSVTEVSNLQGIIANSSDVQCRTVVKPTLEGDYKTERMCKAIVKVPLKNLAEAYDFTIDKKYGIKKEDAVKKIFDN